MGRLLFGAGNTASTKGGKRKGKRSASNFTKDSAKAAKKLQTRQTLLQTVQHEVDCGSTHLYAAARRGDGAWVQELIEGGSSVNEATTSGWTPLHVAAQNGHLTVVMKLIAADADVDKATTDGGWTPLYIAAFNGMASSPTLCRIHPRHRSPQCSR